MAKDHTITLDGITYTLPSEPRRCARPDGVTPSVGAERASLTPCPAWRVV